MNYRAEYKDKADAANAIGVSVSLVDRFDKARTAISANPALRRRNAVGNEARSYDRFRLHPYRQRQQTGG